jgi:hypothetical protein
MKVTIECTVDEFSELFKTTVTNNVVTNEINNTSNAASTDTESLDDYYRSIGVKKFDDKYNQVAIDECGDIFVYNSESKIIIDLFEWISSIEDPVGDHVCVPHERNIDNINWKLSHRWIKDL